MNNSEQKTSKEVENSINGHDERIAAFGYRIGMLHRLYRLCTDPLVSKVGIPFILVPYLGELYHRDGITQDTLAQRVCMDKGSTARAVAQLERLGLIRREENFANRRQKFVYLTDKAARLHDEFFRPLYGISSIMSEDLTPEEQKQLLSFFDIMTKRLQAELAQQNK